MENYYEILEISETAQLAEIKRAYFKMVRKYPPESDEKNFKRIREAYEILSDSDTKKQYDELMTLSPILRDNFLLAKQNMEQGEVVEAINRLIEIYNLSKAEFVRALLAEAYMKNGNTGNAIKILEELTKKYPQNSMYQGQLGQVYLLRGWHKKAIPALKKALELGADDLGNWIALGEAYMRANDIDNALEIYEQGIQKSKALSAKVILHYYKWMKDIEILVFMYEEDEEEQLAGEIENYVKQVKAESKEELETRELMGRILLKLTDFAIANECYKIAEVGVKGIPKLMTVENELKQILNQFEILISSGKEWNIFMEDERFAEEFKMAISTQLLTDEMMGIDSMFYELNKTCAKVELATNYLTYLSQIKIFKSEYPKLYDQAKSFLDELENPKVRKKIAKDKKSINQMSNLFNMMEQFDFDEEDDDFMPSEETVYRTMPKIGRNEPCPCGSGKKYKRCCGKNK